MRRILVILFLSLITGFMGVSAFRAVESYATARVDALLKQQVNQVARVADISWETVRIMPLHLGVVLGRTRIRTPLGHRVGIRRIFLSASINRRLNLEYIRIRMQAIRFFEIPGYEPDPNASFPDLYDMNVRLTAEIAYDPTRHQLVVRHLDLNEENYGHLRLCLGIDRFNPKEVTDLQFEPLIIRQMNLEYQDETLLKRLVAGDSKHLLDFRQFMTQAAQLEINAAEEQGDLKRAAALSGLQDFFKAPGRLKINLRLDRPVTISRILNARRISRLLDLVTCHFTNA
jgi:hypothetical protein